MTTRHVIHPLPAYLKSGQQPVSYKTIDESKNNWRLSETLDEPVRCAPVNYHLPATVFQKLEHLSTAFFQFSRIFFTVVQVYQCVAFVSQPKTEPTTLSFVSRLDPTSHEHMEVNTSHFPTAEAMKSNLEVVLSDTEHALKEATSNPG